MLFVFLVNTFEQLEKTSSTNEMINIISNLFKKATVENIDTLSYFLLGQIAAEYEPIQLGVGEELAKASISRAVNISKDVLEHELRRVGDLGSLTQRLIKRKIQKRPMNAHQKAQLTIDKVHRDLMRIASASGPGSQELKETFLVNLLANADPKEAKYLVRLITGTMRLGVGDMTVLDALALAFLGSKKQRKHLELAYNVCADIGIIAKTLFKRGIDGIEKIGIILNHPVRPMLAQRVSTMAEIVEKINSKVMAVEEKYDGERIQAHKDGKGVRLFSRRLTDVTAQFPDVVTQVKKAIKTERVIVDGEVVAFDFSVNKYMPFQQLMQRRRKFNVSEYAEKIPVKYLLFDILYLNGKSFLRRNYPARRNQLENVVKEGRCLALANRITSQNLDEIDEFFQQCVTSGLEGIVIKSCAEDSYYMAGAREWSWIKWKPEYGTELSDTLDLVAVGAFAGKGKRAGTYGALLCAVYNRRQDVFQTLCKVGSGFSDAQLVKLPDKFQDVRTVKHPARVMVSEQMLPDYWLVPSVVLEVKGAEITKSSLHTANWDAAKKRGLALRFPRFLRWREEKGPEDATTVEEIVKMSKR